MNLPSNELERAAANVIEKAGMNVVDGATGFGSNLFNGLIGDRVREWRNRNFLLGAAETAEVLAKRGIPLEATKGLPTLEVYAIFQGMAEQDDPDVRKLWAGLLASRMDPAENGGFDRAVSQMLSMMNGTEARILMFLDEYRAAVAGINDLRPPFVFAPTDEQQEAFEAARTKNEELNQQLLEKISQLKTQFLSASPDAVLGAAVRSLVLKRLIVRSSGTIYRHSLMKRTYLGTEMRSMESLDEGGVIKALQQVREMASGVSGSGDDNTPLLSAHSGIPSPSYQLTDLAEYLLSECLEKERG